jgi:surface antigen
MFGSPKICGRAASSSLLAVALLIAGCAASGQHSDDGGAATQGTARAPDPPAIAGDSARAAHPSPRIIATAAPLECVPYARDISNVSIRGDAWTWWRSAKGRYRRDRRPAIGSVLVLERTNRLRYGHVAVVSGVVNDREILVDHANWLNRGRIHKNLPVRDVSAMNDWSVVRVWYAPGNTLGKRRYPAYGFIHPGKVRVSQRQEPGGQGLVWTSSHDG